MAASQSHSGHAVDLLVAHRIIAVSANDFLAERRCVRGQAHNATVMFGASSAATGAAGNEGEGAAYH